MIERLALTNKNEIEKYEENKENDYLDFQKENETKNKFLKRVSLSRRYSCYICKDQDIEKLKIKLNNMIPESMINIAKKESDGESWIIVYGYDQKPYCNKGGWGKTESYPFITSDGKTSVDMYKLTYEDSINISDKNFITPFNRNKDINPIEENLNNRNKVFYVLNNDKKIYKAIYPNVEEYEHIFIRHIPSDK